MRVLVAVDRFAGLLSAVEAARAVAEGWARTAPADEVIPVPMSAGGPGFTDVVHAALGGQLLGVTVRGPLGRRVPATVLLTGAAAYVEAAQACGLDLLPAGPGEAPAAGAAEQATSYGVGELLAAALDAGARRVVVGLGGVGSNDGGAGLLAALGAVSEPAGVLTAGAAALTALAGVDLAPARERVGGVDLVAAGGTAGPLLGLRGTTNLSGPRRGIAADRLVDVDAGLTRLAHLAGRSAADGPGAGAGGGLGYALGLLGAAYAEGFDTVAGIVDLPARVRAADLVVTGQGRLDWRALSGTVLARVAGTAGEAARPCIALAGEVLVGSRELRAGGIEAAYALAEAAEADLAALAARVARTWAPR